MAKQAPSEAKPSLEWKFYTVGPACCIIILSDSGKTLVNKVEKQVFMSQLNHILAA